MKTLELDLFGLASVDALVEKPLPTVVTGPIAGLTYLPHFITDEEQMKIIALLDKAEWSGELSRRVQHYGFKYDYKRGALTRICASVTCQNGSVTLAKGWWNIMCLMLYPTKL